MANLKGQGGIKGLLLLHGEKIVIGLIALTTLWLVYKTTSLPRLEDRYQSTKLQEEISQTAAAVRDAQWPDKDSEQAQEVHEAQPIAAKADNPVSSKPYEPGGRFDSAIVAPTVLRTDPVLLNAVDVRATGCSGLLSFIDERIRKEQELARQREEQERTKKEVDRQEREQKRQNQGGPGGPEGGRRGRGGPEGGPGEGGAELFDPEHPNRRPVQGMMEARGVPLQGGERIETAYWAVVVAKVPIREQLKLYQDAFEKARGGFDPMRDFPQYKGYKVQRAEVIPGAALEWKPVPVYDGQRQSVLANKPINQSVVSTDVVNALYAAASQFWAGMPPDVVDSRFTDYVLTLPLPPLVGREWGSEATHPDIPLLADTPPLEEEMLEEQPVEELKQPGETDENASFSSVTPGAAGPGASPYAEGARPGGPGMRPGPAFRPGGGAFGPEGGPGFGRGSIGRGVGPEGGRMMSGGAGPVPGVSRSSLPKGVDFLLLRFFDFAVEPGKRYKYRVTLVLADPNYAVPETSLAPEVLDRRRQESQAAKAANRPRPDFRLLKDWSDASPAAGIPLAGGVRLADIKIPAAEKMNDEPSVTMLVNAFDTDDKGNAIQAASEKLLRRGSVANMVQDAEYLGDNGAWIDTRTGFKFNTGITLIDVEGGQKLSKDYTAPGRVLVMGPAGQFYVRNELDDKPVVDGHRMIFSDENKRNAAEGPEGPGGPGVPRPRGRR